MVEPVGPTSGTPGASGPQDDTSALAQHLEQTLSQAKGNLEELTHTPSQVDNPDFLSEVAKNVQALGEASQQAAGGQ